jgi:hypothetical protein
MKRKIIKNKVGLITRMPGKTFYISYGWKKTDAVKAAKGYRGGGFAKVLNKTQYNKIIAARGRLTENRVKKLIRR